MRRSALAQVLGLTAFAAITAVSPGCGNVCEQAADYRFDCGAVRPEPADQCGGRSDAACEAACVLDADCIVFANPGGLTANELSDLTAANAAYESCLADCTE